jgi:hypothetical protein
MPKKNQELIVVSEAIWNVLLEIEALRTKERKLIRKLWYELKEPSTRRIHRLVFEQAMQSDSAFPTMNKKELDNWVSENISTVFITLIEQGDIIVEEEEPSKARQWIFRGMDRIKHKIEESREKKLSDSNK